MTTTKKQLAEWIEMGIAHPDVEEERLVFISKGGASGKIDACALGCALVGKYDDPRKALKLFNKRFGSDGLTSNVSLAALLKIPLELASKISRLHFSKLSARQIAKKLRSGKL